MQRLSCPTVYEPEEGEIVDEFELISSDEEFNMRQRIRELEAENEELEKIANISGIYNNEYNYADKQHITRRTVKSRRNSCDKHERYHKRTTDTHYDSNYNSSPEFVPIGTTKHKKKKNYSKRIGNKDRHRHKNKNTSYTERQRQLTNHYHSAHTRSTQQKRHTKHSKECSNRRRCETHETISLDSTDNLVNEGFYDSSNSRESILNRDELKRALARNIKLESAPDYQLKRITTNDYIELSEDTLSEVEQNNATLSGNSSTSLGEQELRLIALKSAYMKKHVKRKQRDAEMAYSPTDLTEPFVENVNGVETMDLDEEDIENIPIIDTCSLLSPKQVPSPLTTEDESTINKQFPLNYQIQRPVNTKPVDMDIATSEESNMDETNMWLETIPLPSQLPDAIDIQPPQLLPFNYNNNYGMPEAPLTLYMPEMQFEQYADEVPPPPPPFQKLTPEIVMNINDNAVDHQFEQCSKETTIETQENINYEGEAQKIPTFPVEEDDEEEAEALRALLLAKFQPAKAKPKQFSPDNAEDENNPTERKNSDSPTTDLCNDNEVLPSKLIPNSNGTKPTASILKDAVRRFQTKHNSENIADPSSQAELLLKQSTEHFGWNQFTATVNGDMDYRLNNFHLPPNYKKNKGIFDMGLDPALQETLKKCELNSQWSHCCRQVVPIQPTEDYTSGPFGRNLDQKTVIENKEISNDGARNESSLSEPKNAKQPDGKMNVLNPENAVLEVTTHNATLADAKVVVASNIKEGTEIIENTFEPQITENTSNTKLKNGVTKHPTTASNSGATTTLSNNLPDVRETADVTSSNEEKPIGHSTETDKAIIKKNIDSNKSSNPELPELANNSTNTTTTSIKTSSETQPKMVAVSNPKLPSLSTSTAVTHTHFTKIVKPNKVINKSAALKRKAFDTTGSMPLPLKKSKSATKTTLENNPKTTADVTPITQTTNANMSTTTRLITSSDLSSLKVPRLVINLRSSDTETSDDDNEFDDNRVMQKYNDNSSPLSFHIQSATHTPERSNTPDNGSQKSAATTLTQQNFEEKLNKFLRTVRSQVDDKLTKANVAQSQTSDMGTSKVNLTQNVVPNIKDDTVHNIITPLAVRHLPAGVQQEYLRLLHRMDMLEKQKQAKITSTATCKENLPVRSNAETSVADSSAKTTNKDMPNKSSLIRKVLVKNTEHNNETLDSHSESSTIPSNTTTPASSNNDNAEEETSKKELLSSYETSIKKIGAGINTVLDSSLALVEEAKNTKITKLHCELRMEQLRAELKSLEHKHRQAQQKISQISPQICTANTKINALKQRQMKLEMAAMKLGSTLYGEHYSTTCSDLRADIKMKSKHLASQIKYVNSLKVCDIKQLETTGVIQEAIPTNNTQANATRAKIAKDNSVDEVAVQQQGHQHHQTKQQQQEVERQEVEHAIAGACSDISADAGPADENSISDYISPLAFKNHNSKLDPFATVCPYELNGECKDTDCNYLHLNAAKKWFS